MELYEEIWQDLCSRHKVRLDFPELDVNLEEATGSFCYQLLCEIRDILRDEALPDADCFDKIEKIVEIFEAHNLSTGSRHDC